MNLDTDKAESAINALIAVRALARTTLTDLADVAIANGMTAAAESIGAAKAAIGAALTFVDVQASQPIALELGIDYHPIPAIPPGGDRESP